MATVLTPSEASAGSPRTADPAAMYGRAVRVAVALTALGGLVAALCRSGLAWDGSYILFSTLHEQRPFITHGRLTSNLMLWPVVALSSVTHNLTVLGIVFTALWAAVPCLALVLCWLLVRHRRPSLVRWPTLGICLVTLPGQFFFASEALAAAQLFWVVVLWVCVDMPRRWLPGVIGVSVAVELFHPAGGGLLIVGGAAIGVLVVRRPDFRLARTLCALAFVGGGVLRMEAIERTGYEGDSFRWAVLGDHFDTAVKGAPLLALVALVLTVVALAVAHRPDVLAGAGITLAGGIFVVWALHPQWWGQALNYRSWGPLISAGLMGLCALATAGRRTPERAGRPLLVPMAAVYTAVIVVQSLLWRAELVRLADGLPEARGCRHVAEIFPRAGLPVAHWGVRTTSLLMQNRTPTTLVVNSDVQCADFGQDRLPLAPYESTPRSGWFDLSGVARP